MSVVRRSWLWTQIPLDQPVMLALASAVGYLIAYLDRLGEAVALGVPADYISVSTTDALSRVSVVLVALALMLALSRLESALAKRLPDWAREPLNTLSTWLFLSGCILVLVWRVELALVVLAFGLLWATIHSAYSYLRRDKSRRVRAQTPGRDGPVILDQAQAEPAQFQMRAALLMVLALAALFFAFVGGNMRATSRESHLVSIADKHTVLLVIYDDKAVLGDLKDDHGTLGSRRDLVTTAQLAQGYVWTKTGPLVWEDGVAFLPLSVLSPQ